MGVHGLSGYLKRLGIASSDASSSTASPTLLSHNSTTLAIDGNGLIFHLFRLAYYRHRKNVQSSATNNTTSNKASLQSQLLLPSFTPLSLVHEVTTAYLSELTTKHDMHLKIYFDGPSQYMKRHEKQLRRERRADEWENVRQLCLHGILPESGVSKYRSSARQQAREYERQFRRSSDDEFIHGSNNSGGSVVDNEAEVYLSSFPLSPLVMDQIERSIDAFEQLSPVLPCGSIQVIQCDGEADVVVAKASADDISGMTYALACDSDYLIYGYNPNDNVLGETKYIQFSQMDPSADVVYVGNVLTRSDVAAAVGLPSSSTMMDLSILMGNDYTGPLVRHADLKKRKEYWESIRWYRDDGEGERLPPEGEMSWFDIQGIMEHVAEKILDGWKLTSDNEELKLGMDFSYALYSFGDISGFPSTAPGSASGKEGRSEDEASDSASMFPSLPRELDLSLIRDASDDMDLAEVALLPLTSYKTTVGVEDNELQFIEQRHIDAFRLALEISMSAGQHIEPPRQKMHWKDVQSLYILEKCLLSAINNASDMPYQVFDHSVFHSCLESLSFEDFPLDNEVVSKNEKAFLEEATTKLPAICEKKEEEPSGPLKLPIDAHKEDILHTVKTQRVTIIHGETGCGKSSRVPCFLLRADPPEPTRTAPEVKMIVSQPRRIAAKALAERVRACEPDLTDKIGLRMGHGIREYERSTTRAWFVTTGYVVRLLANHPGWFDSHTHLIIDEVHERSVDTDILCLLCRRLLQSHPTIRLVLMSATMAAELYSQYFGSPQPPIHVGARCFPIKEYFVEDLTSYLSLSPKNAKLAQDIYNDCEKNKCHSAPSASNMQKLYKLATQITTSVGDTGSSVLIFVPGMADIEAISELIEGLNIPNIEFICLPIHSDVPFEEQMAVFEPAKEGEVKVIIATNAAESSLTLPDVDHVICLGLCKQITYNIASHRQMLVPTWISRASATQRAGRTGRVREGNVYRLYSRNAFHQYMPPFEAGEMVRIPLDQVILSLRDMLGEAVTPILLECLEPPDIFNINRSFQSLHDNNFISEPTDEGEITSLGSLVVALGIDLTLGALVGLGIQFGVAAEAIELAAILSFPKTPWAISSPMYHDADTFNEIVSKTFTSRCHFDAGIFSEPMAIANLLWDYSECKDRNRFIWKHRVSGTRMKHLYGTVSSLKQRVAECLSIRAEVLDLEEPPYQMHPAKLNILRVLQVWLFHDTMIVHNTAKSKIDFTNRGISIDLDGPPIARKHLQQIFDEDRHPFEIKSCGKVIQQVRFDPPYQLLENSAQYFESFGIRFTSYVLEKNVGLSYYFVGTWLKMVVPTDIWESNESRSLRDAILGQISVNIKEMSFLGNAGSGNQRGIRGRACGAWHPPTVDSMLASDESIPLKRVFVVTCQLTKAQMKNVKMILDIETAKSGSVISTLYCSITDAKNKVLATIEVAGQCDKVSNLDLGDLCLVPGVVGNVTKSTMRQSVSFPPVKSNLEDDQTNTSHTLIEDSPEGARLLSVLASERRKDNFIRFSDGFDESFIDINLPKKFSINGNKWKRKDGGGMVFVPENCIPMAVIPLPPQEVKSPTTQSFLPSILPPSILPPANKGIELFGCCANTLDLRGGACRVEGITLLPPGRLFVGLALVSFGFYPRTGLPIDAHGMDEFTAEEKKVSGEVSHVLREASDWIFEKESIAAAHEEEWRVLEALDFHKSCMELGEVLECQPNAIKALCELFDGVGGSSMTVWEGYDVSLSAVNASLRPKHVPKRPIRNIVWTGSGDKIQTAKKETANVDKEKRSHSKSGTAKSAADSNDPTKKNFACTKCKAIFTTWKKFRLHHEKCNPGTNLSRKQAAAFASELEGKGVATTSHMILHRKDDSAQVNESINIKAAAILLPSQQSSKQTKFACVKCKTKYPTWGACVTHRDECCPGTKLNMRASIALAAELETNESTVAPQHVLATNNNGTELEQSVQNDQVLKGKWMCQGCNETFTKRNKCDKHMEQCCFGLVKDSKPKIIYECKGCNKTFAKMKKCQLHMNDCLAKSAKTSAQSKAKKAKKPTKPKKVKQQSLTPTEDTQSDVAEEDAKTSKPMYACRSCGVTFSVWSSCLGHMVECNLGNLATLDRINPTDFAVKN